jgi:hypothetical protein
MSQHETRITVIETIGQRVDTSLTQINHKLDKLMTQQAEQGAVIRGITIYRHQSSGEHEP